MSAVVTHISFLKLAFPVLLCFDFGFFVIESQKKCTVKGFCWCVGACLEQANEPTGGGVCLGGTRG